jgi:hypothetical protein
MEDNVKVITVSVIRTYDIQEFINIGSTLSGSARLVRGETNIPITSKLGIISLCDGQPFNVVFTNCSDAEISQFEKFQDEPPINQNDVEVKIHFGLE